MAIFRMTMLDNCMEGVSLGTTVQQLYLADFNLADW